MSTHGLTLMLAAFAPGSGGALARGVFVFEK